LQGLPRLVLVGLLLLALLGGRRPALLVLGAEDGLVETPRPVLVEAVLLDVELAQPEQVVGQLRIVGVGQLDQSA